ncbi:MAG: non-canonical purine NTP pyrophosphatase [Patescibacteria group bacterium]
MKYFQIFTTNENKAKEYQQYAKSFGVTFDVIANDLPIPELQSEKYEDILRSKVAYIQERTKAPFIVEDTVFITSRYKNFPGANAKFVNNSLGIDGWKRLFEEGDSISAITTIGLSYLGEVHIFTGRIDGTISFTYNGPLQNGAPINSIFYIPAEQKFLADLIQDNQFENHRKKALKDMFLFIQSCEKDELASFEKMTARWNQRAETWKSTVKDKNSFVNYEDGFQRFSSVISKFLPVINGRALDIGCGDGAVAKQLAKKDDVRVIGIDASEEMIRIAKKEETHNLSFTQTSLHDLAAKEKFDCIVSRGILISHLPFTVVFDYLQDVTSIAESNSYFIFDFLQHAENGDFPSNHHLNTFTVAQLCGLMHELGWVHVYTEGSDAHRVRTIVFHKYAQDTVYFATGNPLKIKELAQAIGPSRKHIQFYGIDIDEIKSDDLEKIVVDKLVKSYEKINKPVICTDGGIFIEALNGFPGENSKQAAKKLGAKGLLTLLESVSNRTAIRRNCIGYYDGSVLKTFVAEMECEISTEMREEYPAYEMDKILIPVSTNNPKQKTYAEMPVEARVEFTELPQFADFIKAL